MSKFTGIAVVFLLIGSSIVSAGTNNLIPSVPAITLWQFGQPRLLGGDATLPLQPLGTASDGSATTYLYQVANLKSVTTTDTAGVLNIQTTEVTTPRTIVASASGWFEPFNNGGIIECSLINSGFGACMDTTVGGGGTTANSGVPTPAVLQVALTAPPLTVPTLGSQFTPALVSQFTSAPSASPSALLEHLDKPQPSVGAIVGGVLGGIAALVIFGIVLFALRRRRIRPIESAKFGTARLSFEIAPQVEAAAPGPRILGTTKYLEARGWPQDVARAQYTSNHDTTTASPLDSEWFEPTMDEIVDRLRRLEAQGIRNETPPP
ncbi:hypothetical protein DFH09DRAFT_1196437, partial [Mycena vulgaris]